VSHDGSQDWGDFVTEDVFNDLVTRGVINADGIDYDAFRRKKYHHFLFAQALSASDMEIPEELRDKLKGKKFVRLRSGSAAAPWLHFRVSDDGKRLTGEGFVIKPPDGYNGDESNMFELMGAELSAMLGAPGEGGRVDGLKNGSRTIVIPFGGNMIEGKMVVGVYNHKGNKKDRLLNVLSNFVLNVGDRHGFNGMVFKDENGNDVAYPIDFGRASPGRTVTEDGLRNYWETFDMDRKAGMGARDIGAANELGRELLPRLKAIDFEEMARRFGAMYGDKQALSAAQVAERIDQIRKRVNAIIRILETRGLGDVLFQR
jgi:hypothetical protein